MLVNSASNVMISKTLVAQHIDFLSLDNNLGGVIVFPVYIPQIQRFEAVSAYIFI